MEVPPDIPPNLPFVRRILEEQHPASPNTSPAPTRKGGRPGSARIPPRRQQASEEGTAQEVAQASIIPGHDSPSQLPPKFPRTGSQAAENKANSSSPSSPTKSGPASPVKGRGSGDGARRGDDGSSRTRPLSDSPSPVRSSPPKPSSPTRSYSSSFASSPGSLSRSPSRSPTKAKTRSLSKSSGESIEEALEEALDEALEEDTESRVSSMGARRKSWMAASSSRKTVNSQSSTEREVTKPKVAGTPERKTLALPNKMGPKQKANKSKVMIQDTAPKEVKAASPMVRRRPQSAPNKKPVKAPTKEPEAPLGEFSKSLKLLGLDIPSTRTEATKLTNQEVKVTTKEPTIRTRILKRSGSYADLTQNIKKDMKASEFEAVRNKVKEAVFEQWYFKKCAEEREKKLKQEEEAEKEKKEKEEKQKELDELSKEEFTKWCKEKRAKNEKEKKKKEIVEKGKVTKEIDHKEVQKKNCEWLAMKKKDMMKKKEKAEKERLTEEKKKIEEDKRRTEAEKTFLAWKEEKTKKLKEKYMTEKKKVKEKQEALEEKRKDADSAFIGWKNKKAERVKKIERVDSKAKMVENCDKTSNNDEVDNRNVDIESTEGDTNSKLEEAKQAYEAWLDLIEEREEENLLFEEERKRILMWKPPWYAGGKALF